MSTTEGRKRLQPRMSRGSWKLMVWFAAVQTVIGALLNFNKLWLNDGFDAVSFWIYTGLFAVGAAQFLHLIRVRRNDGRFWDEEEARQAEWDRRGRRL